MAKILHNNGKYDEAWQILQQIEVDSSVSNNEMKLIVSEMRARISYSMGKY